MISCNFGLEVGIDHGSTYDKHCGRWLQAKRFEIACPGQVDRLESPGQCTSIVIN